MNLHSVFVQEDSFPEFFKRAMEAPLPPLTTEQKVLLVLAFNPSQLANGTFGIQDILTANSQACALLAEPAIIEAVPLIREIIAKSKPAPNRVGLVALPLIRKYR